MRLVPGEQMKHRCASQLCLPARPRSPGAFLPWDPAIACFQGPLSPCVGHMSHPGMPQPGPTARPENGVSRVPSAGGVARGSVGDSPQPPAPAVHPGPLSTQVCSQSPPTPSRLPWCMQAGRGPGQAESRLWPHSWPPCDQSAKPRMGQFCRKCVGGGGSWRVQGSPGQWPTWVLRREPGRPVLCESPGRRPLGPPHLSLRVHQSETCLEWE